MFDLQNQRCQLTKLNVRTENHGPERVLAANLKFDAEMSNDVLSEFDPQLKASLYDKPREDEGFTQGELINEPGFLPTLRFPEMSGFKWDHDFSGYELTIHYGIGSSSNITLVDCKVNDFSFTCKDGGTVHMSFRVQCNPQAADIGRIAEVLRGESNISLTPPEPQTVEELFDKKAA